MVDLRPGALDDLKQQCIEATTLRRMAGCLRSGDINANRTKVKLRYKQAVNEAARDGEAELNDELANHLCTKVIQVSGRPGGNDFAPKILSQPAPSMGYPAR